MCVYTGNVSGQVYNSSIKKEKEIQMLECSVCEKKTEDLDWCIGCGFICEGCDHED